jgi:hypothetical protein
LPFDFSHWVVADGTPETPWAGGGGVGDTSSSSSTADHTLTTSPISHASVASSQQHP